MGLIVHWCHPLIYKVAVSLLSFCSENPVIYPEKNTFRLWVLFHSNKWMVLKDSFYMHVRVYLPCKVVLQDANYRKICLSGAL